ncbi:hypothetical protein GCM10027598_72450 [Amycolatopsis oliviviridis]|uniref:Excreted virulence factor EspC, type VII ESX diderm n=1 Tax=Amycolatopsis oliviviridis TaxID=1471590 RepID=A0ABQ3L3D9_9PSEU|nr:type VII secretion target [Amycolatopsis oliviviridis]GHH01863.1 hypothetical protein GCM10017790_02380 [Amycolatopsis oliviviridis]
MSGYRAQPDSMRALARRLEVVSGELGEAARLTGGVAGGDLGPAGIASALDAVIGPWSASIGSAHTGLDGAAAGIRTAAKTYEDTDDEAAWTLRHESGDP